MPAVGASWRAGLAALALASFLSLQPVAGESEYEAWGEEEFIAQDDGRRLATAAELSVLPAGGNSTEERRLFGQASQGCMNCCQHGDCSAAFHNSRPGMCCDHGAATCCPQGSQCALHAQCFRPGPARFGPRFGPHYVPNRSSSPIGTLLTLVFICLMFGLCAMACKAHGSPMVSGPPIGGYGGGYNAGYGGGYGYGGGGGGYGGGAVAAAGAGGLLGGFALGEMMSSHHQEMQGYGGGYAYGGDPGFGGGYGGETFAADGGGFGDGGGGFSADGGGGNEF